MNKKNSTTMNKDRMFQFNPSLDIYLPIMIKMRKDRRLEVNVIVVMLLQQNIGQKKKKRKENFQGKKKKGQTGAMSGGVVQALFFCKKTENK